MSVLAFLLQGAGLGVAAAAQPGPYMAYVIAQTLAHGWRRTLPAAFAPLVSDGPIIVLMLLILTRLPDSFRAGLHLAGGAFIFYLARNAFLSWRNFTPVAAPDPRTGRQSLLRAALMNVLGPGPYLFWSLAAGPLLLQGWRTSPAHALGFLSGFYGVMIGCLIALIVIFGTARRLGPGVNRGLLLISTVALAAFGAFQWWQGVAALRLATGG